jgi:putative PEP-CTERM system histidine kinase
MDSIGSPLSAWGYGIACGSYALFALHLLRRGYRTESSRTAALLAAITATSVWAAIALGTAPKFGQLNGIAESVGDQLRYAAWYWFLIVLVRSRSWSATGWMSGIGGTLLIAGLLLPAARGTAWGHQGSAILAVATVIYAIFLLEQLLRNIDPDSRWNIKPLVLGLGAAFLFDLYAFSDALLFGRFDPELHGARGLIHTAVLPLLALAATRGGSRLARIQLSQRFVVHSTALVLVGLYLVAMSTMGYYVRDFGGEWGHAIQYALGFLALLLLLVAVFSATARARVRVFVSKHFFRYRYDYREEWLRFTNVLSSQSTAQDMGQQVVRGLADLVESPAGSLWLRDPLRGDMVQAARWNAPIVPDRETDDGSLCSFLRNSGWVINLEEYRRFSSRYRDFEIPDWLSHTDDAWLVVPLFAGQDMIGFVVLLRARTEVDIDWEVNDLLKTAGRQAAGFLAQALAVEALIESRKFEAFNRMSAFVVHDLKNIVSQLALLVRNAERHGDDPEFRQDMLMTVQNAVEKMRQLMLQLREGAAPAGPQHGVPLGEIAQRIARSRAAQGRCIEVETVEPVMARGHPDRIERVIGHAVQNGIDATDPSGRVWVRIDREGGRARVVVGDDGRGMSEEFIRERLFKPFQTTKQSGMGIGAYESFQYIRELGGDIRVESRVGAGTTLTMLLPLFEAESANGAYDAR